jgi:hypothetical protein
MAVSHSTVALETRFGEQTVSDDPAGDFRARWRTRFDYVLGQIFASLEGNVFRNEGELGNSVFLRIRRTFGSPDLFR